MDNAVCNPNGKIWLFWINDCTCNILETDEQHITACGLTDIGYNGQQYTWCNQRSEEARVWKRLDRAMVNDKWLELMPQTTILHLYSVGSDHLPLLIEIIANVENNVRYFKFLHCWVHHEGFIDLVKACWDRPVNGDPMWTLHKKIKRLTSTLSNWSKKEFGDIFAIVKEYEEKIKIAEEEVILNNIEESRTQLHYINAQYIKYLKLEESILKQKTQLQWFKEGDANTKYFHALMRGGKEDYLFIRFVPRRSQYYQCCL
ncbi:hypothetical protein KY285_007968 [Solanum tuberosum]|nr:hypothetical protein KY285_007968 [Solanum tuberosum]